MRAAVGHGPAAAVLLLLLLLLLVLLCSRVIRALTLILVLVLEQGPWNLAPPRWARGEEGVAWVCVCWRCATGPRRGGHVSVSVWGRASLWGLGLWPRPGAGAGAGAAAVQRRRGVRVPVRLRPSSQRK
ncbi:hypothetical protein JB92DRAFT_2949317 [Gautieria morchelliformis]|nr:hypothetical protein JB92DRAFT_2949317 [Gautieria morchelliformis]